MNSTLKNKLKNMAEDPKAQLTQLAIGTLISLLAMLALVLTSDLEILWLFYLLNTILIIAVIYAIPGYIGVWLWRMKGSLFKD